MQIDAALTTTDLNSVPAAAAGIEAAGYDGVFSFEGQHDPFFPLLLAAEHTERGAAHDRRRDRVRPQSR